MLEAAPEWTNDDVQAAFGTAPPIPTPVRPDAGITLGSSEYLRTRFLEELDEAATRPTYPTGVPLVDDALGGGFPPGLNLLGGMSSVGKTSFALNAATTNARAGTPVLLATYEMGAHELWGRIARTIVGVPLGSILRGEYRQHGGETVRTRAYLEAQPEWPDVVRLGEFITIFEGGDAFRQADGGLGLLHDAAARLADAHGRPPLVIVDYIQRVGVQHLKEIRERIDYVAGRLQRDFGNELRAPVLALSSLSRLGYQTIQDKSPEQRLAALKESGGLEYTSVTATLLTGMPKEWQSGSYRVPVGHSRPPKPLLLQLLKNRHGPKDLLFGVDFQPADDTWSNARPLDMNGAPVNAPRHE